MRWQRLKHKKMPDRPKTMNDVLPEIMARGNAAEPVAVTPEAQTEPVQTTAEQPPIEPVQPVSEPAQQPVQQPVQPAAPAEQPAARPAIRRNNKDYRGNSAVAGGERAVKSADTGA